MNSYSYLASFYDSFTGDINYCEFADFYERVFSENPGEYRLILDLCCGTGTLTEIMAGRGYDMTAVDSSYEMLMAAREKLTAISPSPLLLCQDAEELDLYGTVDAAYSSLDSFNYLSPDNIGAVLKRLFLFIRPGGMLIFDIHSPEWMEKLSGQVFVDETEDALCLWRADFSDGVLNYSMDIFSSAGELWEREQEEHTEYAYSNDRISALLRDSGFSDIRFYDHVLSGEADRIFVSCKRK